MMNDKSSRSDGLSPLFFKFYWDVIKHKVIDAVQFFFREGYLIKPLNHTFITLIPKKEKPNLVQHFCPISLCNVVYKIITKILSNRLRPVLDKIISPY